jgi:putative transposase
MTACQQARLPQTPPVIVVDGVNLKVLGSTGAAQLNARGQLRPVKRRQEKVLLMALGVWPDGSYQGLFFEIVDQETKASWKQFFSHLVAKGLNPQQLQVVVSDGRPGLDKAIHAVFPQTVKHQRCIFHKLKNLADNLTFPHLVLNPALPYRQALQQAQEARARAILQDAVPLYHSADSLTLSQRLTHFQQKWTTLEPKAVRCFIKDFDLTLTYRRVPFPQPRLIRTTNLLERFFREFRRRADELGCFGSPAQAETLLYLIMQREKAKHAVA